MSSIIDRTAHTVQMEDFTQAEELKSGWSSDRSLVIIALDNVRFGMSLEDAREFAAAFADCIAVVEAARNGGN